MLRDAMKPAPFQYHAPTNRRGNAGPARQVRRRRRPRAGRRAKPGADHGVPAGAAEASGRHQRRRRARTASRSRTAGSASAPACAMPRSRSRSRTARSAALLADGRAPHRASPDPHAAARSAAASPTPIRRRNGARSRRRSTPRWWPRASAAARASIAGDGLLRGHHDDGAARGRTAARGAAADPAEGHRMSALPNSAAAPATTPSPWRSRPIG